MIDLDELNRTKMCCHFLEEPAPSVVLRLVEEIERLRNFEISDERIAEIAAEAVADTQELMIMEYKNFEARLYVNFFSLIMRELRGDGPVV